MNQINSIGFALDPTNIPSFLLDWELTKLCNLDCSYCSTGITGGHDNTTRHPPLEDCLKAIDFMYEYVDQYMQHKRPTQRKVVLNVYGGESVFHPDIVEILRECHSRYEQYQDRWHLTVTCTTNAIVGQRRWAEIVPLVDEFTVSYHAENLPKQRQQFLDNILYLKQHNRRFKCVVMMHNNPELFEHSKTVIEFCKTHRIRHVVKPLDNRGDEWTYTGTQFNELKTFWMIPVTDTKDTVQAIDEGRACCGGRRLSVNSDLKSNVTFVPRQGFEGWSCSVNWFFLFLRQVDRAVFSNKDCRMSTTGQVEPLGYVDDGRIIDTLKTQLATGMPVIKCKKEYCRCGFCAPKAEDPAEFKRLIMRNLIKDVFVKEHYDN